MNRRWMARIFAVPFLVGAMINLAGATQPSVAVTSPLDGATVAGVSVPLVVEAKGFKVDCALAGKAPQAGIGHWHVILDGGLVDMACGPGYLVSLRNVKPGQHTLMAVPAQNNHMEIKEGAAQVNLTYRPEATPTSVRGVKLGRPRLSISFPGNGTTVSGQSFPLILNVRNFRLSCELEGKPQVVGTGHWHVHLDRMAPGMAGLATLMAMGCTNNFEVPLQGIRPGTHTFIVVLTDNLHAPIQPMVMAQVTVRVK